MVKILQTANIKQSSRKRTQRRAQKYQKSVLGVNLDRSKSGSFGKLTSYDDCSCDDKADAKNEHIKIKHQEECRATNLENIQQATEEAQAAPEKTGLPTVI